MPSPRRGSCDELLPPGRVPSAMQCDPEGILSRGEMYMKLTRSSLSLWCSKDMYIWNSGGWYLEGRNRSWCQEMKIQSIRCFCDVNSWFTYCGQLVSSCNPSKEHGNEERDAGFCTSQRIFFPSCLTQNLCEIISSSTMPNLIPQYDILWIQGSFFTTLRLHMYMKSTTSVQFYPSLDSCPLFYHYSWER